MNETEKLASEISKLRSTLEELIRDSENNLIKPKIVEASQQLDEALNKYSELFYD